MARAKPIPKLVRPLRGGQITIPIEFRRALGLDRPGAIVQLSLHDGELRLRPVHAESTGAGSPWFAQLYDLLAPVREEAITKGYSEEEINAWIDEAIQAVRARKP
jgi:bifunctional DNA-binding transcriptional regulator/antitoxin component of YhaV-PrlF toxin-antitoxin module